MNSKQWRMCETKLMSLRSSPRLPSLLLLMALSTVFLFAGDRDHFYRPDRQHNSLTSNHLVVASNLSLKHNLVGFHYRSVNADGSPIYDVYNRFPIGGYALIKLAIMPFGDSLSAQIYAARLLMLAFFAAAAILAYHAIARLTSSRWIALTATLLAFSSYNLLYYNDTVASETMPDLFGLMLTFHGMVIFVQEGRFRQLLVKTCIALLLGWHVYGLLLPFIVFGLVSELIRTRSALPFPHDAEMRSIGSLLFHSRHLRLGVVALLSGMAILSFNFANEYFALNGETPLTELPTFKSLEYRTGQAEWFNNRGADHLAWPAFLKEQFQRVGSTTIPYPGYVYWLGKSSPWHSIVVGIVVLVACLIGLVLSRNKKILNKRILWATLVLSGFCWALPMRHSTAFHNFEGLYYIGIPLALFSLTLLYRLPEMTTRAARRRPGAVRSHSITRFVAVAALLVFGFSSYWMARVGYDAEAAYFHEAMIADFEVIRDMTDGKTVYVPSHKFDGRFSGARQSTSFYLSGRAILYEHDVAHRPDFVISRERVEVPELLTPENRLMFLYDLPVDIPSGRLMDSRLMDSMIEEAGEPIVHSNFDVYLHENRLVYVKDPCSQDDVGPKFFLHVFPVDENDLSENLRANNLEQHGFDNLDFRFADHSRERRDGSRCMAVVPLPEYNVKEGSTGQFIYHGGSSYENIWQANFDLSDR